MKIRLLLVLPFLLCTQAHAELLGMITGRSARITNHAVLSIEAGFSWYTQQLKWSAARINLKPAQGFVTYLDLAQLQASGLPVNATRHSSFAGTGFGGGVVFMLPKLINRYDLAFKAAYHSALSDSAGGTGRINANAPLVSVKPTSSSRFALQQSQWSADFIVSPIDPLFENGVSWYASAGYVVTNAHLKPVLPLRSSRESSQASSEQPMTAAMVDYQQKRGAALGVGLIMPKGPGQLFAGLKLLAGDPLLGIGFRYAIR